MEYATAPTTIASASLLLDLPDPCLLSVLQCCAASGPRCLLSAARTHSRLHQAAGSALSSIAATTTQEQLDSLVVYMSKQAQHITTISLVGNRCPPYYGLPRLLQLPTSLRQLDSLSLTNLAVQLQPGSGQQGVLHAGTPIRSLRLQRCQLLNGTSHLAPALAALPQLQHLSITGDGSYVMFHGAVLQGLQQLTSLQLSNVQLATKDLMADMQHLAHLTCLQELRLQLVSLDTWTLTAEMVASLQSLTHLQLYGLAHRAKMDAAVLTGKSKLQHLCLKDCGITGGAEGVASLLLELQQLTQLTHLSVQGSIRQPEGGPPAAAYAALTASSRLQHLDMAWCWLPCGVLQHVLPATRQLASLRGLDIRYLMIRGAQDMQLADITRLVSCCPGLQSLVTYGRLTAELLAPLRSLTGLQGLTVCLVEDEGAGVLAQMTRLRLLELHLCPQVGLQVDPGSVDNVILQLTQLQHLTSLQVPAWSAKVRCCTVQEGSLAEWLPCIRATLGNHTKVLPAAFVPLGCHIRVLVLWAHSLIIMSLIVMSLRPSSTHTEAAPASEFVVVDNRSVDSTAD